jgi:hypothetical protein
MIYRIAVNVHEIIAFIEKGLNKITFFVYTLSYEM